MIKIADTYFWYILTKSFILSLLLLNISISHAQVPTAGLVGYYPFSGNTNDESGYLNHATNSGASLTENRFGQMDNAYQFNGIDQYIEIPDDDQLSISDTDSLTISVWMRNDVLDFTNHENDYVHWMGKGVTSQHEWALRIYNLNSIRPNRTSCYSFNLSGGLGAGSYVQENVSIGEWIHIVAVYNYPTNTIQLYKNGELKDTDLFSDYSIIPENGTSPVRIGTRDFDSYYQGAIDDIRFYSRVLTVSEISELYHEDDDLATEIFPSVEPISISLYPNPVNQILSLKFISKPKNVEIVNSIGNSIYSKTVSTPLQNTFDIDVSNFASGLYLINIHTANGVEVKRFVKE